MTIQAEEIKPVEKPTVQFHMLAKLPNSGDFHASPSGDTEYEEDYRKALFAAKPPGFEIVYPRTGHRWSVNSEGYTIVPLYITNTQEAHLHLAEEVRGLRRRLSEINELAKKMQTVL